MKRTFLFLVVALCFLSVRAQQTSLLIDNQTPGWLSSKIGYADQKTVQNLEITGYLNYTDLTFIGELISKQNLNGVLNLENVYIVGDTEDNVIDKAYFGSGSLKHLLLPKSLISANACLTGLSLDTLTAGGESMQSICAMYFYDMIYSGGDGIQFNKNVKNFIIREGVVEIPDRAFYNTSGKYQAEKNVCVFSSISLPGTLVQIGEQAFEYNYALIDLKLPEEIEEIKDKAFYQIAYKPDTLRLPKYLKKYHTRAFDYTDVICFDSHIELIDNSYWVWSSQYTYQYEKDYIQQANNIDIYINASTPPEFDYYSLTSCLAGCRIFVPKGSAESYMNKDLFNGYNAWSYAKEIIEQNVYVTGVVLDKKDILLKKIGQTCQLTAKVFPSNADNTNIIWYSENEEIATVDDGKVTAVGNGVVKVYAVAEEDTNIYDYCLITIAQQVEGIALDHKNYTLNGAGSTVQLTAHITPTNAYNKNVIWYSEDDEIATVDNGKVTAVNSGVVKIYVVSEDDSQLCDSCEVVVNQPVAGITLNYETYTLGAIGETLQLVATVYPENASNKEVNWKSSNENVCIVSNGTVVAVNSGTSVIIATTVDGGYMAVCTIVVQSDTGIADIKDSSVNYKVYSLYGQRQNTLQRGVNIVVFEDGTKAKVFVK